MINKTITDYTISVNQIKQQLNLPLDYVKEDSYIQSLIEVSTQHISNLCACDIEETDNVLISSDKHNLQGLFYESPFISIQLLKVDGEIVDV